ncbi:hypothetical protein [Halomonas urumqiensis]|uniref:Uncharacterized protein n=1 Tax=Halomonas urumqiensis TaxID=1684789 RepID=A0A2N7UQX0_9GAMM|nr:hypothetical protein [Halomonas urumqiensis]PMR82833.1 hypothetical protein C1H70_00805 [Halomonas urumqiensis]PTB01849.1 hypothetical protein C6V82_12395 [Halomonas urumqiensis]GHE21951.1 hypothetical protein GCM10017767_24720 [Halomonas urumqiensis]
MPQRIAVLTGDVIDSRKVNDRPRLYQLLDERLAELATLHGGHGERFRGDGFQLALPHAAPAMQAAVALRAALIEHSEPDQRWDARIAVAVGPAQRGIADADSDTFVASGRALDALADGTAHLALARLDAPEDAGLTLLVRFIDDLIDGWSPYSAEVVGMSFRHEDSQQALAKRLGIRQPSVHKRLRAARWALLSDTLAYFGERLETSTEACLTNQDSSP